MWWIKKREVCDKVFKILIGELVRAEVILKLTAYYKISRCLFCGEISKAFGEFEW